MGEICNCFSGLVLESVLCVYMERYSHKNEFLETLFDLKQDFWEVTIPFSLLLENLLVVY